MSSIDKVFDGNMPLLEKKLDLVWRRSETIASNVANAETPKYKAIDLDFGQELKNAMDTQTGDLKKTNSRHMDISSTGGAHIIEDRTGTVKADGNSVDIDIQMGRLQRNSSEFTEASLLIRKKLRNAATLIRYAGS